MTINEGVLKKNINPPPTSDRPPQPQSQQAPKLHDILVWPSVALSGVKVSDVVPNNKFCLQGKGGSVTIDLADGRVEIKGWDLDESALQFWQAVERMAKAYG